MQTIEIKNDIRGMWSYAENMRTFCENKVYENKKNCSTFFPRSNNVNTNDTWNEGINTRESCTHSYYFFVAFSIEFLW